jgi:hypothetical protein
LAFGYAAALAPRDKQLLYDVVFVLFPAIIVCKAFLNSAPLKERLMFHVVSPLGIYDELVVEDELLLGAELLLLVTEELVVVDVEVLLLVADVESAKLVEVEVSLLGLLLTSLVVLGVLGAILEDCVLPVQPLTIKAMAVKIVNIFLFFIAH